MSAMLRAHRLSAGMTLEALADRVGVTKSYLSKVERGKSSPSIAIALRIAETLGVDAADIFGTPDAEQPGTVTVERAAQRIDPASAPLPIHDPIAAVVPGKQMHPFVVYPTQIGGSPVHHEGDELVYVTAGSIRLIVDDETTVLHVGDSAYFDARRPHRLTAEPGTPATALVVTTIGHHHPHSHDGTEDA
ncbi:helix-turn-helix domain-containing protein [Tsukamurella ocularis]|uniref:helix-turn-helix domain-containing protein n=1 Tax=Tsukamurella ocularis TaxID=1970234 RepID=UPI00216A1640|nr:XRE family transcriptional regulator [Tsukamurella ocularis]MCS3779015.1 transcriptional regulator with XRE-family HTH domain [Tsukamurella ocularis]MCS3787365.1 transcriptional regulator with XRE-family HTH domain [Tsukamurella ocularis]MCS3851698.1 transcriptional regulator with XRE-family HTH domain [Tsukamurella ocularis]